MGIGVLLPLLLLEAGTALSAMDAAGVVLALARQHSIRAGRVQVAVVGVSVAHAPTADGHVLDRVEVAPCHRRILPGHRHQVPQQVLGADQADTDVGRSGPLLQHARVEVVDGRGPVVQQHDRDLSVLQRHNLRVLVRADDVIVARDRTDAALEDGLAVGQGVGEVLPRGPGLAVIHRLLQGEGTGTRRIAHSDENVGYVKLLRN